MTRLSVRAFAITRGLDVGGGLRAAGGAPSLRGWLETDTAAAEIFWQSQSMTPVVLNGGLGEKVTVAVLGDGFGAEDQDAFDAAVEELFTDPTTGLFAHDYFRDNAKAFNLLRINLVSAESPANTITHNADDTVTKTDRDTALRIFHSGVWDFGWSEDDGTVTPARVARALSLWAPEHHQVFVILNNPGYGGRATGYGIVVSRGVDWALVGHEFGHSMGGLGDEYCGADTYDGDEPGAVNITANTDRATLKWRHLVAAGTPIPTGAGSCATYNQGPRPATWDDNQDVGLFEGATISATAYGLGLHRPVLSCRMNQNTPEFCPVCRPAMDAAVSPFLVTGSLSSRQEVGVDGYLRLLVRKSGTSLDVLDARELPGSFVEPSTLPIGLAHEVLLGGRRIAVGAMPDAGVERGFGDPARPTPEHSVRRLDTFDFVVRVPRERLRGADLSALRIDVVSVVGSRPEPLGSRPLAEEPGLDVVPVAALASPSPSALPPVLRLAAES